MATLSSLAVMPSTPPSEEDAISPHFKDGKTEVQRWAVTCQGRTALKRWSLSVNGNSTCSQTLPGAGESRLGGGCLSPCPPASTPDLLGSLSLPRAYRPLSKAGISPGLTRLFSGTPCQYDFMPPNSHNTRGAPTSSS